MFYVKRNKCLKLSDKLILLAYVKHVCGSNRELECDYTCGVNKWVGTPTIVHQLSSLSVSSESSQAGCSRTDTLKLFRVLNVAQAGAFQKPFRVIK